MCSISRWKYCNFSNIKFSNVQYTKRHKETWVSNKTCFFALHQKKSEAKNPNNFGVFVPQNPYYPRLTGGPKHFNKRW